MAMILGDIKTLFCVVLASVLLGNTCQHLSDLPRGFYILSLTHFVAIYTVNLTVLFQYMSNLFLHFCNS